MSSEFGDPDEPDLSGLEDEPIGDWTNFGVLEILAPDGQVAMTIDLEVIADHCLSDREFQARALQQAGPLIAIFVSSPKFRQRFGTQPQTVITFTGCTHD